MDIAHAGLKNNSSGAGKIYKMSLDNLIVPENKEALKQNKTNQQQKKHLTIIGLCQRDTRANWRFYNGPNWNNLSNNIRIELDYNPK